MTLFNWLKKAILLIGSKSSTSRTDAVRVNDKNAKNQNASWKRWVLSEALETVADDDCLMFNGNLFHLFYSFGPVTEYLWPNKQSMWTYGPKYRVFRTMVLNTEYLGPNIQSMWTYGPKDSTCRLCTIAKRCVFRVEKRNDDITFLKLWDAIG